MNVMCEMRKELVIRCIYRVIFGGRTHLQRSKMHGERCPTASFFKKKSPLRELTQTCQLTWAAVAAQHALLTRVVSFPEALKNNLFGPGLTRAVSGPWKSHFQHQHPLPDTGRVS